MGDDAQQDEMQMESSQGGATGRSPAETAAGSPAWEAEGMHAGNGHESDVHEREAPKTLASRISRFAGIFIGRKTAPDTPTGGCSAFNGACYVTMWQCKGNQCPVWEQFLQAQAICEKDFMQQSTIAWYNDASSSISEQS